MIPANGVQYGRCAVSGLGEPGDGTEYSVNNSGRDSGGTDGQQKSVPPAQLVVLIHFAELRPKSQMVRQRSRREFVKQRLSSLKKCSLFIFIQTSYSKDSRCNSKREKGGEGKS